MDLFRGELKAMESAPIILSLYGFKVLADSADLYRSLGLDLEQQSDWDDLKRTSSNLIEKLDALLSTYGMEHEPLAGLHSPGRPETRKIADDTLGQAILTIDRLDAHARTLEDLRHIGQTVDRFIEKVSAAEGRAGGEYFTPQKTNSLAATLLVEGIDVAAVQSIYDPVCGTGGGLVAAIEALRARGADQEFHVFGQDIHGPALFLCTWNLILHGIVSFTLAWGDTLREPAFLDEQESRVRRFDVVTAAPPFSLVTNEDFSGRDRFQRFRYGEVSGKRSDYAFVQHVLASIVPEGRALVFVAPGTLFRVGFERTIRENLVHADVIDAVISLPAGAFFNTGMPTGIALFNMKKPERHRKTILFIAGENLSRELGDDLTQHALTALQERGGPATAVRVADLATVQSNDYNLMPARYVQPKLSQFPEDAEITARISSLEDQLEQARDRFDACLGALDEMTLNERKQ